MQSAQHTLHRLRFVVLHEGHIQTVFHETLLVVAFKKIATFIYEHVRLDDEQVFYLGFYYFHGNNILEC